MKLFINKLFKIVEFWGKFFFEFFSFREHVVIANFWPEIYNDFIIFIQKIVRKFYIFSSWIIMKNFLV